MKSVAAGLRRTAAAHCQTYELSLNRARCGLPLSLAHRAATPYWSQCKFPLDSARRTSSQLNFLGRDGARSAFIGLDSGVAGRSAHSEAEFVQILSMPDSLAPLRRTSDVDFCLRIPFRGVRQRHGKSTLSKRVSADRDGARPAANVLGNS